MRASLMEPSAENPALRVLFVTTSVYVGGAESLLVNLVRRLDRRRFAPELCCLKEPGPLGEELAREIPVFARLLSHKYDLRVVPRLVGLLRRRKTDVLITVGPGDKMFWGRLAAWCRGVPVVLSQIHSEGGPAPIGRLNRVLTPLTDMFVGVGEAHRRLLIEVEHFPPERVCAIPNGVDTERFAPQPRAAELRRRLGISPGPLVGTVTRLIAVKNHDLFLEVAARTRREIPDAQFLIVGDGPERARLERRTGELGLSAAVHFAGLRSDVPELLSLLDVFLLTSDSEANPVCVLEALACGVPVVSTRVGCLPETVPPSAGRLCAPGDAAGLAAAVVELLGDPPRARALGRGGREHVLRHWSLEQMVRQYEDLMSRLYAAKTGRTGPGGWRPSPAPHPKTSLEAPGELRWPAGARP